VQLENVRLRRQLSDAHRQAEAGALASPIRRTAPRTEFLAMLGHELRNPLSAHRDGVELNAHARHEHGEQALIRAARSRTSSGWSTTC